MTETTWMPAFRGLLHDSLIEAGLPDEQVPAVMTKVMGGLDQLHATAGDTSRAVGFVNGFHDWHEQTLCLDADRGEVGWAVPHTSVEDARADLGEGQDEWVTYALVPVAEEGTR